MSVWNHRVVRRVYPEAAPSERVLYEIHEAHYKGRKATKPYAITLDSIAPYGETIDELRWTLTKMLGALDKPTLDYGSRNEIKP